MLTVELDSIVATTKTAVNYLLERYFELSAARAAEVVQQLRAHHPEAWIYPATVEAIYQGRYRWVSIAQILLLWQRRGRPSCHFSADYERLLLGELPETLNSLDPEVLPSTTAVIPTITLLAQPNEAFIPAQDQSGLTARLCKTLLRSSSDRCAE